MKKLLLILLLIAIAVTAGAYILIPNSKSVAKVVKIDANHNTIYRALTAPDMLKELLKNNVDPASSDTSTLKYGDSYLQFQERMNDIVEITIEQGGFQSKSFLKIIPLTVESCILEWRMPLSMSYNPFKRIQQYMQASDIKANMTSFLEDLNSFVTQKEKIYGYNIKRARLTDSLLITTKATLSTPPTPEVYYSLIKQLQAYAEAKNVIITNYPMLNITALGSTRFQTMVALPINKPLPDNGSIVFKRMVPGNILITEVKGGHRAINNAFDQLGHYMSDYGLTVPAIPFQSLVTDRLANKDSSQWITKLYYPIY